MPRAARAGLRLALRSPLRVVAALGAVVCAVMLALAAPGPAVAATAGQVAVLQQGWFWQTAYEQANPPVAQAAPATEPSGVPDGDLAVAYTGASDHSSSKVTALSFDLSSLPAHATVEGFTFALHLDTSPSATSFGQPGAAVVACLATRGWPAQMPGDYTNAPSVDCARKVAPTVSGNTYTFTVPAMAQSWIDDQNLGLAVVADPATATAPFQLVFTGAKDLRANVSWSAPVGTGGAASGPGGAGPSGGGPAAGPVAGSPGGSAGGALSVPPVDATGSTGPPVAAPAPVVASSAPVVVASPVANRRSSAAPTAAFWGAGLTLALLLLLTSLVLGDPMPERAAASRARLDRVLRDRSTIPVTETT